MAETAPRSPLSQNEAAALGVAVLGHVALVTALIYLKPADLPPPSPERMSVTISDETGLVSTSPDPQADPALDSGPVEGDMAPPPVPEPVEVAQAQPRPIQAPVPRPLVQPKVQPQAKQAQPQARPAQPQAKLTPRNPTQPRPGTRPGNSRFDSAFGNGIPQGNPVSKSTSPPAAITGEVRSSLAAAITRQLRPKWRGRAPEGLEADKLVTILTWDLNLDGTLAGSPKVVRQEGITPANRAQAARHAEEAIRAVRLVGKFDLPPQYYAAWKHVSAFRFDRSLGQ